MIIDKLDKCRILVALKEDDMTGYDISVDKLNLKDENAKMYVQAVIPQLSMWIGDNVRSGNVENLFV